MRTNFAIRMKEVFMTRKERLEYNKKYDEKVRKNRNKIYKMAERSHNKLSSKLKKEIQMLLPAYEAARVMNVIKHK